jgi:hypothetical protein
VSITIRKAVANDINACGRVMYDAFETIARQHNFNPDFPSVEVATSIAELLINHPSFYGVVAERDGFHRFSVAHWGYWTGIS